SIGVDEYQRSRSSLITRVIPTYGFRLEGEHRGGIGGFDLARLDGDEAGLVSHFLDVNLHIHVILLALATRLPAFAVFALMIDIEHGRAEGVTEHPHTAIGRVDGARILLITAGGAGVGVHDDRAGRVREHGANIADERCHLFARGKINRQRRRVELGLLACHAVMNLPRLFTFTNCSRGFGGDVEDGALLDGHAIPIHAGGETHADTDREKRLVAIGFAIDGDDIAVTYPRAEDATHRAHLFEF